MSRASRYPPPDDYYDDPPPPPRAERRRRRDYDEVDVDVRERTREPEYRRGPDYLREDYGRSDAGPLVRTRRETTSDYDYAPPRARSEAPPAREEVDVDIRESSRVSKPRRRDVERDDINIDIRREDSRAPPPSSRGYDDREILVRRGDGERRPKSRREIDVDVQEEEVVRRPRRREDSRTRIEVDIREDERRPPRSRAVSRAPPPPEEKEDDIDIRYTHKDSDRTGHRDTLVVRERSRSRERSRGAPIMREREDIYYRRRPSPPRPPRGETEDISIRIRRESPPSSPSPEREPTPPPPEPIVEPITRPPIIQEVITHHRHIDHGVIRVPPSPSSSPSPPPPPRPRRENVEVDIRRKDARGNITEEDIRIFDSGRDRRREYVEEDERKLTRRRSVASIAPPAPAPPPAPTPLALVPTKTREETNVNINIDADFLGNNDRRVGPHLPPPPARPRPREMWTEITKDLVTKEAITSLGYQYEETDDFFYVMDYLRYDDIVRLVEVSDDIRYGRRDRIDQIQWERQDPRLREREREREREPPRRAIGPAEPRGGWDERIYEREVVYEDVPRRRR